MKTLKSFREESIMFYTEHPEYFKKTYSKKMGGTQTLDIEGVGVFSFDDREYYKGRGLKYNSASMHEDLGIIKISYKEFEKMANSRAKFMYDSQKSIVESRKIEREVIRKAASLIGEDKVNEGIELVLKYESKTYLFIENVMFYKGYNSENVSIEIVSPERRAKFVWEDWFKAPYASVLGMTIENKNLFIC